MSLGRFLVSEDYLVSVRGGDDGHVDGVSDTKRGRDVSRLRLPRPLPRLTGREHLPSFQWSGRWLFEAN